MSSSCSSKNGTEGRGYSALKQVVSRGETQCIHGSNEGRVPFMEFNARKEMSVAGLHVHMWACRGRQNMNSLLL